METYLEGPQITGTLICECPAIPLVMKNHWISWADVNRESFKVDLDHHFNLAYFISVDFILAEHVFRTSISMWWIGLPPGPDQEHEKNWGAESGSFSYGRMSVSFKVWFNINEFKAKSHIKTWIWYWAFLWIQFYEYDTHLGTPVNSWKPRSKGQINHWIDPKSPFFLHGNWGKYFIVLFILLWILRILPGC
jgi:hypothetical protein